MKRIVTVAAALALTLSLAGCWGGDKPASSAKPTPSPAASSSASGSVSGSTSGSTSGSMPGSGSLAASEGMGNSAVTSGSAG